MNCMWNAVDWNRWAKSRKRHQCARIHGKNIISSFNYRFRCKKPASKFNLCHISNINCKFKNNSTASHITKWIHILQNNLFRPLNCYPKSALVKGKPCAVYYDLCRYWRKKNKYSGSNKRIRLCLFLFFFLLVHYVVPCRCYMFISFHFDRICWMMKFTMISFSCLIITANNVHTSSI